MPQTEAKEVKQPPHAPITVATRAVEIDLRSYEKTYQTLANHIRDTYREIKDWDETLKAGAFAALSESINKEQDLTRRLAILNEARTMPLFSAAAHTKEINALYRATVPMFETEHQQIKTAIHKGELTNKNEIARRFIENLLLREETLNTMSQAPAGVLGSVQSWWNQKQLAPKIEALQGLRKSIGTDAFPKKLDDTIRSTDSVTKKWLTDCQTYLATPTPKAAPSPSPTVS